MAYPGVAKWTARPATSAALRYGLALVSVAAALGLAHTFRYFHLPQPFTAFALSAIAITFWYGGMMPGMFAALLSALVRSFQFQPETNTVSSALDALEFLIFALLMNRVTRTEEALSLFRTLIDQSNDAVEVTDPDTLRFLDMNQKGCADLGYTREEILSLTVFDLDPTLNHDSHIRGTKQLRESGSLIREGVHLRKDGSTFPVELNIKLVQLESRAYVVTVARDITERKRAEEGLRRLSGQLLRLQDEERRRIARDLHDSTGQNLVALATMLGQLCDSIPSGERTSRRLLSECKALAVQCIREVRTLSYVLHPPALDLAGIGGAIRDYMKGFTERSGIQVELELSPGLERMARDIELALFRVVQESLTNIQRHSGSQQAKIRIQCDSDLTLEVSDGGRGASAGVPRENEESRLKVGVGIASMRERVKLIGGRLDIDSTSHGTTVRVTLPHGGERT